MTCQSYWCNSQWVYKGLNYLLFTGNTVGITIEVTRIKVTVSVLCIEECSWCTKWREMLCMWTINTKEFCLSSAHWVPCSFCSQNETTKGQRGWCAPNDSLSSQSKCVCNVFTSFCIIYTFFFFPAGFPWKLEIYKQLHWSCLYHAFPTLHCCWMRAAKYNFILKRWM